MIGEEAHVGSLVRTLGLGGLVQYCTRVDFAAPLDTKIRYDLRHKTMENSYIHAS